jgi:hypothetical protein
MIAKRFAHARRRAGREAARLRSELDWWQRYSVTLGLIIVLAVVLLVVFAVAEAVVGPFLP